MVCPWDAVDLEWDDENEAHLARHHVRPAEVQQVFEDDPLYARNRGGRASCHRMIGRTAGNRALVIYVQCDDARLVLRPITARSCTAAEISRWNV